VLNLNKDVILNLLSILDEEIVLYRKVLDVSTSEFNYFVERNYDAISNHIQLKEEFYSCITDLEFKRDEIMNIIHQQTGYKFDSIRGLCSELEDNDLKLELLNKRTILRTLITRIQEANNRNKTFLEKSQKLFSNIFNNLAGLVNKEQATIKDTYDNSGRINNNSKTAKNATLINKEV